MSEEPPAPAPPAPPSEPLGERVAKLEAFAEAEDRLLVAQDKLLEHGLEGANKALTVVLAVVGLLAAASVAFLVYLLQRLDQLAVVHK